MSGMWLRTELHSASGRVRSTHRTHPVRPVAKYVAKYRTCPVTIPDAFGHSVTSATNSFSPLTSSPLLKCANHQVYHLVHMCQHIFTNIFKGVSTHQNPNAYAMSQNIQWHFDNRISIRVSLLLIVRLSILNVITLTKCLDHRTKKFLLSFTLS